MIRQIAVLSGKGGAGKTSITAALIKMMKTVIAVDADVNASNLPILLPHQRQATFPYYGMDIAKIQDEKCIGCGRCLAACHFAAIQQTPAGHYRISADCEGCAACAFVCPAEAVIMTRRNSGSWYVSSLPNGTMIHADLTPGEDNSGKLITEIRRKAAEVAKDQHISYIVIDGPPGTSCQAISAMTGTDVVLAVVEESLSGLSDYRRLAELIHKFSIPHYVLINKAGFSQQIDYDIVQTAAHFNGRVAGRIAFNKDIPAALQNLQTLADLDIYRDFFNQVLKQLLFDP